MRLTLLIAFRNLMRQKRRTILLGIGIAFGIMILVIAQSYANGLSNALLNYFIPDAFGHVQVNIKGKVNNKTSLLIRDKNEIIDTINNTLDGVNKISESIFTFTKAVGNGGSALILFAGIPRDDNSFFKYLQAIDGDKNDFNNKSIENPILLFSGTAEKLKVKSGDTIKIKLKTIYGQIQSARFTVIAIVNSINQFFDNVCYVPQATLKGLLGYREYETSGLKIKLEEVRNPEVTVPEADKLHSALTPKPAAIFGTFKHDGYSAKATTLGLRSNKDTADIYKENLKILKGSFNGITGDKSGILISKSLADKLHAGAGSYISFRYQTRFEGISSNSTYKVAAIITGNSFSKKDAAFLNEKDMYKIYFDKLPEKISEYPNAFVVSEGDPLYPVIASSWKLLERTYNKTDMEKKKRRIRREKWNGQIADVYSMQEIAEPVLQLEAVLKTVTGVTVLILFFIIFIGVVNMLRMTVRERTREIGTIRAIGMHRKQVRRLFITETVFLSLFASISGIIIAFIAMGILSQITFESDSMFSMLMAEGHIMFLPDYQAIFNNIILTIIITIIVAYFPARKAASLSVVDALRNYE